MIYLDSCLVIYLVEARGPAHHAVRRAMSEYPDDHFAISPLVVMECLVGPYAAEDEVRRTRYEHALDPMTVLTMGMSVYERAARLRASHRLKTPDALHLATALEGGCDELWTNDDRLSRAAGSFARVVGR